MSDRRVSTVEQAHARRGGGLPSPCGDRPLSFAQERLWLAQAIEPDGYRYNEVLVYRVSGALRAGVLAEALARLAERHEILRTSYALREGGVRQFVQAAAALTLAIVDLTSLDERAAAQTLRQTLERLRRRPFRLEDEIPTRAALFRRSRGESLLAIAVHHIACDRTSADVFVNELCALYDAAGGGAGPALPPVRVQYSDFAVWERQHFTDERLEKAAAYWRELLEGAGAPALRKGSPGAPAPSSSSRQ